jgi:hypothetical protein
VPEESSATLVLAGVLAYCAISALHHVHVDPLG